MRFHPIALLANDGSNVVAWFSNRGGNQDIYIARCDWGTTWYRFYEN